MTDFDFDLAKDVLPDCPTAPSPDAPGPLSAYRRQLLDVLREAGMVFPGAREMSESELEEAAAHRILLWLDETDLREVHIYQIPDEVLSDGLRVAFGQATELGPERYASSDGEWAASVRIANAINKGVIRAEAYDELLSEVTSEEACPTREELEREAGLFTQYHRGRYGRAGGAGLADALFNTRLVGALVFNTYA